MREPMPRPPYNQPWPEQAASTQIANIHRERENDFDLLLRLSAEKVKLRVSRNWWMMIALVQGAVLVCLTVLRLMGAA
jgi:hypothetical protein